MTWSVFVVVGMAAALLRWPLLPAHPFLFFVVIAAFVVPPAWIHIAWIHFPGYLFMSNRIRRLYASDLVESQISRNSNRGNPYGVPSLPNDLRTAAEVPSAPNHESRQQNVTSARVVWEEYLLVSSSILWPGRPMPHTTQAARLDISADAVTLSAGRWRPGTVFELPISSIVGVWDGRKIATIDSGRVLVLVVDTGQDRVLLPFEIMRGKGQPRNRDAVKDLVHIVNQRRWQ
ncbi:hypothetical protein ABIC47_001753 [Leifsonia sp. 563]|uniref:hypothetical protein n=1 Tax=Leifsonia sp. 563 TaxID=3156412 RepID=UPI00339AA89B